MRHVIQKNSGLNLEQGFVLGDLSLFRQRVGARMRDAYVAVTELSRKSPEAYKVDLPNISFEDDSEWFAAVPDIMAPVCKIAMNAAHPYRKEAENIYFTYHPFSNQSLPIKIADDLTIAALMVSEEVFSREMRNLGKQASQANKTQLAEELQSMQCAMIFLGYENLLQIREELPKILPENLAMDIAYHRAHQQGGLTLCRKAPIAHLCTYFKSLFPNTFNAADIRTFIIVNDDIDGIIDNPIFSERMEGRRILDKFYTEHNLSEPSRKKIDKIYLSDPSLEKAQTLVEAEIPWLNKRHGQSIVDSSCTKAARSISPLPDDERSDLEQQLVRVDRLFGRGQFPAASMLNAWTTQVKKYVIPDRLKIQIGRYLFLNCFSGKPQEIKGINSIRDLLPPKLQEDIPVIVEWLSNETKISREGNRITLRNDIAESIRKSREK